MYKISIAPMKNNVLTTHNNVKCSVSFSLYEWGLESVANY